jgi:hypothetical protein
MSVWSGKGWFERNTSYLELLLARTLGPEKVVEKAELFWIIITILVSLLTLTICLVISAKSLESICVNIRRSRMLLLFLLAAGEIGRLFYASSTVCTFETCAYEEIFVEWFMIPILPISLMWLVYTLTASRMRISELRRRLFSSRTLSLHTFCLKEATGYSLCLMLGVWAMKVLGD